MEFQEEQAVKYNGSITYIDHMYDADTCRIKNPDWDWDMEAECVAKGIDYDVPFWLTVKISELSPL